jgi:hypothetical protein
MAVHVKALGTMTSGATARKDSRVIYAAFPPEYVSIYNLLEISPVVKYCFVL